MDVHLLSSPFKKELAFSCERSSELTDSIYRTFRIHCSIWIKFTVFPGISQPTNDHGADSRNWPSLPNTRFHQWAIFSQELLIGLAKTLSDLLHCLEALPVQFCFMPFSLSLALSPNKPLTLLTLSNHLLIRKPKLTHIWVI